MEIRQLDLIPMTIKLKKLRNNEIIYLKLN